MNNDDAVNRYKATGEKFKEMTDPSSYSKFYDYMNKLKNPKSTSRILPDINIYSVNKNSTRALTKNGKETIKGLFKSGNIQTEVNNPANRTLNYTKESQDNNKFKYTDHFYMSGDADNPAAAEMSIKSRLIDKQFKIPKLLHKPYSNFIENKVNTLGEGGVINLQNNFEETLNTILSL